MTDQQQHPAGKVCDCGEKEAECGCGCGCHDDCCGGGDSFQRRYRTRAEQIADLETYLGELKLEVQAVEEHLADLRK